jgi:hypothetical protein
VSHRLAYRDAHASWPVRYPFDELCQGSRHMACWRVRFQQVFFALTTVYSQERSISRPHVKYVSTVLPPHDLLLCFATICVNLVWKGVKWILNIEAGIHIECWRGQDEQWIDLNRLAWRSREVGSRRTTSSDPIHTDHRHRNYVLDRPTAYVIICAQ